jgi:predicted HD phosphohydrolase
LLTVRAWAADEVREVLTSMAAVVDGNEPVDELAHALQCATHALASEAPPELVAACLFHDVGRAPVVRATYPALSHEQAGSLWVEPRFGEKAAWLVAAHVPAKIYLAHSEKSYLRRLSSTSAASLAAQIAEHHDLARLCLHPWWPEALQLRRWDDAAKIPAAASASVYEVLAYLRLGFG